MFLNFEHLLLAKPRDADKTTTNKTSNGHKIHMTKIRYDKYSKSMINKPQHA